MSDRGKGWEKWRESGQDLYTYVCVDKWREEQGYIELMTYQNENRLQNHSLRGE